MSARARICVIVTVLTAFAASNAYGQDLLNRVRRLNEVKVQKLVGDVNAALAKAAKLERTDPGSAYATLSEAKALLEGGDAFLLQESKRVQLLSQITSRMSRIAEAQRIERRKQLLEAKKAADIERGRLGTDPRSGVRGPSPFDVANDFRSGAKRAISDYDRLRRRRVDGFTGAIGDVVRSNTGGMTEQRITPRFVAITKARKKKLTAAEQKVLKTLNSVMSVDLNNATFAEAITYLQERTKLPIIVDKGSLREVGATEEDPVKFRAKKVSVRTILRKVLGDLGLTYVIRDGTIQVVSLQRAREMMVVRTYSIAALTGANQTPPFLNPLIQPAWQRAVRLNNVQGLINTIAASVDPAIWQQGGSITYYEPGQALVIRAPAEVHYQLNGLGQ